MFGISTNLYKAYTGNNGEVLSARASLAQGFAMVRSNRILPQQLPLMMSGIEHHFENAPNNSVIDKELKWHKHLYLFSIILLKNTPLSSLFNSESMRSANQEFSEWSAVTYIVVNDDEDEDESEDENQTEDEHPDAPPYAYQHPEESGHSSNTHPKHNPEFMRLNPRKNQTPHYDYA